MSETAQPYLVVDALHRKNAPPYQAFLDWLKAEGVDPEQAQRCEVFEARDGKPPYAVMTMYEVDEAGRKVVDEVAEEFTTYTDIVTLSSLPPLREV